MSNHGALAIANAFVERNGGPVNQFKLQKLVYLAHGWNLAINRRPLVVDQVQAWDGGPVYKSVWNYLRDVGHGANGFLGDNKANLLQDERAVIDQVWNTYGGYSGAELSRMTHQAGTPWTNAYFNSGRNSSIPNEAIERHFIELAEAGRD